MYNEVMQREIASVKERMKKKLKKIKWELRNLFWSVYGTTLKNPSMPSNPKSLLFICKGNICRSPFAERLAVKIANNKGYGGINIDSVGLEVSEPLASPENAILSAAGFGVRLDDHKSKMINHEIINSVDMILAMEPWHLKSFKKSFPQMKNKTFLLSLFEKENTRMDEGYYRYHITDPYGQSLDQFQICYRRIERCILDLFIEIGFHM
jgi:protein-tyrosine phosphatase